MWQEEPPSEQPADDWTTWVLSAKDQDATGFTRFEPTAFKLLWAYFRFSGASEGDCDDLAQLTVVRVWQKGHTFDPQRGCGRTWTMALARGILIDNWRKYERRRDWRGIPTDEHDDECELTCPSAEDQHLGMADDVVRVLRQMPEKDQELLRLTAAGFSAPEIAEIAGTSVNNVYVRLHRSRQKFGALWRRYRAHE